MAAAKRKPRKRDALHNLAAWAEPGPARPLVTRGQVVKRALEVLDADGFDGLTMRRLAERLEIKAASLYNHVSDKDELLALVADAICEEIPAPDGVQPWRAQVEGVALHMRQVLVAHRDGARVLAATRPMGPNRLRIMEQLMRALVKAGFATAQIADAASVFNSYVVGFVLDETIGRATGAPSSKSGREHARRWFKSLPFDEYPTLVSLADELVDATPDRRFQFGVGALLDGFALKLRKRAR